MIRKWETKDQLTKLLFYLVQVPSVTGTEAEVAFPKVLEEQLRGLPYFYANPDHLQVHPTDDGRSIVTALVKKKECSKTIILISHFDVVAVEDYGHWKNMAFDAEKLTRMFYAQKQGIPSDVEKDLKTQNWVFGRGTMDMKCGLALHMSMVEKASLEGWDGNILLVTVCDEEVNSVGMRSAVPVLVRLAEEYGLEYKLCINSEPIFSRYPGDENKYIYTGSIGKVLPGFYCYGKETHVGEPFSGLNGNYMASQITCEIELNTDFCEIIGEDVTPPPTNLLQRDLKKEYSVQIPHRAVTLFNLFLLEKTLEQIVNQLRETAKQVASRMEKNFVKHAEAFSKLEQSPVKSVQIQVLTFEELVQYAVNTYGYEEIEQIQASLSDEVGKLDDRDLSILLVDRLATRCKELSPMIVLFFAPPYYPAVCSKDSPTVMKLVSEIVEDANKTHGIELIKQNYFPGLSDLSYTGIRENVNINELTSNMPLWNQGYNLPINELRALNIPVLNLGPVGKDAHKWTERLDVNYAFGPLKDMLENAIRGVFKD